MEVKDFDSLYGETEKKLKEFTLLWDKVSPGISAGKFMDIINLAQEIFFSISRLGGRAGLMEAADQSCKEAKVLKGRARDLELWAEKITRPFFSWIKGKNADGKKILDPENAGRLFLKSGPFRYRLEYMRSNAAHTLSQREEDIISSKDAYGIEPLGDLRTLLETAFSFTLKPEGEKRKKIKTQAELTAYTRSHSPAERKAAYRALLEKYRDNLNFFYTVYSSVVKDWRFEAKLRGYDSPISVRNKSNHIPDSAVKTLLQSCSDNRKIFQDYFKCKARALGLRKLRRYDIYAPLGKNKKEISLEEAISTVLDSFEQFSPGFREGAGKIIKLGHIDSHPRPHKVPGAFCSTIGPELAPYILLNFSSTKRDMLTLAHELGHALHSLYSDHLPFTLQHAVLPLAETASTFSEIIVFEKLLSSCGKEEKKNLLDQKLAESYATIIRQNYFVKFELKIHDDINKGLGPEDISEIYFDTLREQFGSSLDIDPLFRYEWAYIPHIVNSPFYCYSYNFGLLLSLSLYARYKQVGPEFIPCLEKIFSAGGSKNPVELLKESGADICSPGFWNRGFSVIRQWLDELKKETGPA